MQTRSPIKVECPGCSLPRSAITSQGATATLLDVSGVFIKTHIPLRCKNRRCGLFDVSSWHNYQVREGGHYFSGDPTKLRCFMLTSSFGCTRRYMQQLHLRLVREHASFAGEAFVAREFLHECGEDPRCLLERLRLNLSDVWYKWRMALRLWRMAADGQDSKIQQLNLSKPAEACAAEFWDVAVAHFDQATAAAARQNGQNCQVAAVDGNMKNRRSCCGALLQYVLRSQVLGKVIRLPCPHTALVGSVFCANHEPQEASPEGVDRNADVYIMDHKSVGVVLGDTAALLLKVREGKEEAEIVERWVREDEVSPSMTRDYFTRIGLDRLRVATERKLAKARKASAQRAFARRAMDEFAPLWDALTPEERAETLELYSADTDLQSVTCGTHKEGEKEKLAHAQTAGILCACLTSGLVVRVREIFGAESLSQRYFFIADLKALYQELEIIVHDDACHLHKFAASRASSSAHAASVAPDSLCFVCDGFHLSGHKDPWCLANCNPDAPPFAERMRDIRTSVCELFSLRASRRSQTELRD